MFNKNNVLRLTIYMLIIPRWTKHFDIQAYTQDFPKLTLHQKLVKILIHCCCFCPTRPDLAWSDPTRPDLARPEPRRAVSWPPTRDDKPRPEPTQRATTRLDLGLDVDLDLDLDLGSG